MKLEAQMTLDEVDVVKLEVTLWTSSKKLRKEDLVLADGSVLPPETLAHLGTKRTIDPENLNCFSRIKKEAERVCLEGGTRFLGGFANPKESIPGIVSQLDTLAIEFGQEKAKFLARYESETEEWANRHPQFREAIIRSIEPVASVAGKIRFDYVIFRVAASSSPEAEASLERKTLGLSDQLFREISAEAQEILDRSLVGKPSASARVLGGFIRIRNKLDSLGFLDHRVMPVVDEIDQVLANLPKNGPFAGAAFNELFRLAMLLADSGKIKQHGSGLLLPASVADEEDEGDGDAINPPVPESEPTSAPEPELPTKAVQPESEVLDELDAFFASYQTLNEALDAHEEVKPEIAGENGDIAIAAQGSLLDFDDKAPEGQADKPEETGEDFGMAENTTPPHTASSAPSAVEFWF